MGSATLYDVGPNYLVMELIDGPTLAAPIGDGDLPPDEALTIAAQIAEAWEAAREKRVKPYPETEHGQSAGNRPQKPVNLHLSAEGRWGTVPGFSASCWAGRTQPCAVAGVTCAIKAITAVT